MSYDSQASSNYGAAPFELYWFTMVPPTGSGRRDWRWTSGDAERTYLTYDYAPYQVTRSEISQDQELSEGAIDVTIPSSSDLAQQFLRGMPIAPIALTIYAGHDGDAEVVVAFSGRATTATFQGSTCKLRVAPDHQAVKRSVPSVSYQSPCNHIVYSAACGLPTEGWGLQGNRVMWSLYVTAVNGRTLTVSGMDSWTEDFGTFPADDSAVPNCSWGYITLPSGRAIMIEAHTATNTLVLTEYDAELQPGITVEARRGCRRTLKHCKFLFENSGQQPRWMGFNSIPSSNPFRGLY